MSCGGLEVRLTLGFDSLARVLSIDVPHPERLKRQSFPQLVDDFMRIAYTQLNFRLEETGKTITDDLLWRKSAWQKHFV